MVAGKDANRRRYRCATGLVAATLHFIKNKRDAMAIRPFIVLGDQTDHGGVVIEASMMTDTHGAGIARVGDRVTCPKHGHGTTVIVTGDPTMIIDGKPAARHGDMCACGATLIARQFVSTVRDGSSNSTSVTHAPASATGAAVSIHADSSSPKQQNEESTEQFFCLLDDAGNAVEGYRYDLYASGNVIVRSGDFSKGSTESVTEGSKADLIFWLNKAGVTKS